MSNAVELRGDVGVESSTKAKDESQIAGGVNRICSLKITGGFLADQTFEFASGLNCVIGGRGAGKTSLLELIRFALDAFPDGEHGSSQRRRLYSLVAANLGGGRVQLTVETGQGLHFVISRAVGEEPMVLTKDGEPTNLSLHSPGFFRAHIYSQNELESIAERSEQQLRLLDSLSANEIDSLEKEIADTRSKLRATAANAIPLVASLETLDDQLALLPGIEEKLLTFARELREQPGSNGKAINEAHQLKSLRDRERRSVNDWGKSLKEFSREVGGLKSGLQGLTASIDETDMARSPNRELLAESHNVATRCLRLVDQSLESVDALIDGAVSTLRDIAGRLADEHKKQELQFQSLIERDKAAQSQMAERNRYERQRNDLLTKKKTRAAQQQQLETLLRQRSQLLEQLSKLEEDRYAARQDVVERINSKLAPMIEVSISQFGCCHAYQLLLERLLKPAKIQHRKVSQKIAQRVWRNQLTQMVRECNAEELAERAELNLDQAEKVISALSDMQALFELDVVESQDEPTIKLLDGDVPKESHSLSTGQKCTSVLPILLLDSEFPLLVDQPDDNLDNRFVYDTVVEIIRNVKGSRQLVFVTHNPNIPVLGDADRVFVLESNGSSARLSESGTVDECRRSIVSILEGGEEAFMERKSRYAY